MVSFSDMQMYYEHILPLYGLLLQLLFWHRLEVAVWYIGRSVNQFMGLILVNF